MRPWLRTYNHLLPSNVRHSSYGGNTNLHVNHYVFASKNGPFDHASASTLRAKVRLPIIINGAGPSGLTLAIGLKNAGIPFEIFETLRHDLGKQRQRDLLQFQRRDYISYLQDAILRPLRDSLGFPTVKSLLSRIQLFGRQTSEMRRMTYDHPIHTESFLDILRQQVKVHYGFRLESEGISCLESVNSADYIHGQAIKVFEGSLLVGADGLMSSGKESHVASMSGHSLTHQSSETSGHVVDLACYYLFYYLHYPEETI